MLQVLNKKMEKVERSEKEKREQFIKQILEVTKEIVEFYQEQVDDAIREGLKETDEVVQVLRYHAYCVRAVKQRIIEGYGERTGDNVQLPPCFPYKVAMAYMYMHHILELCIMEETWEAAVGAEAHKLIDKLEIAFENYDPFGLDGIPTVTKNMDVDDEESSVELDSQEDSQLVKRRRK